MADERVQEDTTSEVTWYTCQQCGADQVRDVRDSRPTQFFGHFAVRRKRYCHECDTRITTLEIPAHVAANYETRVKLKVLRAMSDYVAKQLGLVSENTDRHDI